ncbi:DAK2 domain-containing protein [Pseudohoeflea coraliihabitans]|uniref:DAK2 domain-containing protein n=1 Tax=Pseudohoeflea coraliihabitans TaxID=2860393 RepID=A0ABS6WNI1_9HYPH|nr:DAK2 domain-containing protein [Pseudohoeflea sp. DP4N28-3]MBW3097218.1 DAK2 domain-containing protein [Pseudohoeflea sp. DP4N28-3]
MTVTTQDLAGLVARMHQAAQSAEQRLNEADARLGDGDTGSMLTRIMAAMSEVDLAAADDLASGASTLAQATMKQTGSSLGTLVVTALMSLAKQAKANGGDLQQDQIAETVGGMRDAVAARGKAQEGDKTVLDSLAAIAKALEGGPVTLQTASRAAKTALDEFRDRQCRIGRARMFPERSIGADDPGMLALALLLDNKEMDDVART